MFAITLTKWSYRLYNVAASPATVRRSSAYRNHEYITEWLIYVLSNSLAGIGVQPDVVYYWGDRYGVRAAPPELRPEEGALRVSYEEEISCPLVARCL
jgi:hypothetical protein